MPRYRFRSVLLHAGVLLRHLRRVHVQEPNEPALGHDRLYLQRSHDLLDRHCSVGRFLSRYVPAYGGLQDHVVHGGIGRPLQHQSPDQDRRLLRLVESSSDAGPARGRMASSRRVVSEECPPVGRRGTGDDEAQTSDLLDLRAPLDGLHVDEHAFYLPPIPKLLLQVLSRYRGRLPDPDTVSGLQEEDPDSRPSVQALLPRQEGAPDVIPKPSCARCGRSHTPSGSFHSVDPADHRGGRLSQACRGGQRSDLKELLMSSRSRPALAAAAAILLLVLFIPWTRRTIGADAFLRPVEEVSVPI